MTAVVRPVSIYHLDLGDSGVTALLLEILLAEADIVVIHSQTHAVNDIVKSLLVQGDETVDSSNGSGYLIICIKGINLSQ